MQQQQKREEKSLAERVLGRLNSGGDNPKTNIWDAIWDVVNALDEITRVNDMYFESKPEKLAQLNQAIKPLQKIIEDCLKTGELVGLCSLINERVNSERPLKVKQLDRPGESRDKIFTIGDVVIIHEVLREILNSNKGTTDEVDLKRALSKMNPRTIRLFRCVRLGTEEENGGKFPYDGLFLNRNGISAPRRVTFTFTGIPAEFRLTREIEKKDGVETFPDDRINRNAAKHTYDSLTKLSQEAAASGNQEVATQRQIEAAVFLFCLPNGLKKDWGEITSDLDKAIQEKLGLVPSAAG